MKVAAAWAGLGALVGALLVGALRLAAASDLFGAAAVFGQQGIPRRYVDYLPGGLDGVSYLRMLLIFLCAGLLAGLLIGVVAGVVAARRASPAGRVTLVAGPTVVGLAVGAVLALGLYLNARDRGADFGWYAYAPLRDGVLYGGGGGQPSWPVLALVGALAGVVVTTVGAGVVVLGRRVRSRRA